MNNGSLHYRTPIMSMAGPLVNVHHNYIVFDNLHGFKLLLRKMKLHNLQPERDHLNDFKGMFCEKVDNNRAFCRYEYERSLKLSSVKGQPVKS